MDSKHRYTANIVFNDQPIGSHSSNNLNRLAAQLIVHLEHYPNAVGLIRDNDNGDIIQTYRKTSLD